MNKGKIIKSVKTGRRNPATAFFISLAVTGLGQLYNGRYSAGLAFLLLRAVSEFIVPAYIHTRPGNSYIYFFTGTVLFNLFVWIASPLEALYFSLRNREVELKKWNSVPAYTAFALLNISLLTAGAAVNTAFFSIREVPREKSSLIFTPGDYLLVKKYTSSDPEKGEYIIYRDDDRLKTSRITGVRGDTVEISRRSLILNSVPLRIGIPEEKLLSGRGITGLEDLYFETIGSLTYPVRIDFSGGKDKTGVKRIKPAEGEVLVTDDNRKTEDFFRLIKREQIIGRIEGVIFSKKPGHLFLKSFVKEK